MPGFSTGLRQLAWNNFKWAIEDKHIHLEYERHFIKLSDGGTISLDWAKPELNESFLWNELPPL